MSPIPINAMPYNVVKVKKGFPAGLTSVNTVLFDGDAMVADNTDYSGFIAAFRNRLGTGYSPGKV